MEFLPNDHCESCAQRLCRDLTRLKACPALNTRPFHVYNNLIKGQSLDFVDGIPKAILDLKRHTVIISATWTFDPYQ